MRFTFSDCVIDFDGREVLREGKALALPPKAFQLLAMLIQTRPKAVSKARIHEELWPDTFVSDANLANLVAQLRSVLGDNARNPRIIRTVQRFGYAFAAPVEEVPSAVAEKRAVFKIIWGDREITLREGENILGREQDAAAWVDVHSVSRRHARILVSGDVATLEDLGSKNGTFLKGETVTVPQCLRDGDRFRIGTVEMTVRRYLGGVSTESVRSR
jgi:DNA-binding winged helix-turn-helix (wHTH) protein